MTDSDTPQGQDNTAEHEREHANSRSSIVDIPASFPGGPPAPSEHTKTEDCKNSSPFWKKLDTYRFLAELVILAVTIRIACIYSGQLKAMLKANEIESRPYIGIEVRDKKMVFEPTTKVEIVFHNSGKLPAYTDLFWSLAYSKERSYSPNILAHNAREEVLSPWPVEYPIDDVLAGDVPAQTPKAQAEAIKGMHSTGGFVYVWAQGRYGITSDEARIGRYDTAICTEYTITAGPMPTVGRVAPCPWEKSNYAY